MTWFLARRQSPFGIFLLDEEALWHKIWAEVEIYAMPKRILAIDDNPFILEALQDILEFSGYEVDTLLDGNSVFESIADNPPDLILLDVMLGGLDGREICSAIKESDRTQNIPVILISASHNLKDSMHQKGCPDDFVAKPFDIDFLLNKIQSHIKAA